MARRCEVCNKGVVSGTQYSHSHRQSKRTWAPNIKRVKALVNGTPKTVHICTRCLRSGKVQIENAIGFNNCIFYFIFNYFVIHFSYVVIFSF